LKDQTLFQQFLQHAQSLVQQFRQQTQSFSIAQQTQSFVQQFFITPKAFSTVDAFSVYPNRPEAFSTAFSTHPKLFQQFFNSPNMFSTLFHQTQSLFNSLSIHTMCFHFLTNPKRCQQLKNKVVSTSFPPKSKLFNIFSTGPKLFQPFLPTDQSCFNSSFNRPELF
jgi:hypothetical protein